MALVKAVPFALLATLALTAARHTPPPVAPTPVAAPVAPTIRTGVEKWRAGDYAAAVAIWTPFANAGEPDALFNLGQAYKLGRGVTADAATARDYYRKAALKGHLPAQANLGIALFQAGEKPEAIKWLKTAADRGEARAQYVLGIAAFNGDGVPRSQSLGYGYLLRAQASGLPQAVTALGTIAPGLSPGDRTAGEAVAASLAAGTGVPPALAASSSPRLINGLPVRPATGLPVVTPPTGPTATGMTAGATAPGTMAAPTGTVPAMIAARPVASGAPSAVPMTTIAAAPKPVAPVATAVAGQTGASRLVPSPLPTKATTVAMAEPSRAAADPVRPPAGTPVLPPVPKPAPPVPLREPTPAQADAAAGAPVRSAVAAVDVPASRPTDTATSRPLADARQPGDARDPLAPSARPATRGSDPLATAGARPATKPLKPFEVAAEPAKPEGWRVQLGAFSARRLADAAWADVKATAAPAKPIFATDGPVTKLQMGPFATRDAAKAACTKLTAAGRACFVTQG